MSQQSATVIIGVGEIGSVFARGLLRCGQPVYPVLRNMNIEDAVAQLPSPKLVLVSVGENDLSTLLGTIPTPWRDRIALIQNELLPRDWRAHGLPQPSVVSVWFEKKPGHDVKPLIASPCHGPQAEILAGALHVLGIPNRIVIDADEMEYELVRKNVYILTTNISGLLTGGTVQELWHHHQTLAREVANEIIDIQEWLTDKTFSREQLMDGLLEGIRGDLQHKCTGRSAPSRLARALYHADQGDLAVPRLRQISRDLSPQP